ncbi:uncharacterized protein LOC133113936 [Conger conger]|uniref:uncharacterized protein LOC133113936 n=1 Tax=Conger conger TaxID=82655 RepID=UPI002A59F980|nr:uncharacterized protein LOC133113936 [Conger conger]
MGGHITAHISQGATDPAPLVLPAPGPRMLVSGDFVVAKEGRSFNVSWAPPSHLTGNVQYVVQVKEAGVRSMQAFNWIKLNGSQRSVILTGDFRDYTPYNISLFSVISNHRCLLGSAITYIVQRVPEKVTGFQVSEISYFDITLTWERPLNLRRGVTIWYRLGQGKHTEYKVSRESFLISGLQPGQQYEVWICAENEAGQGRKTFLRFMTRCDTTNEYIVLMVLLSTVLLALGMIYLFFSGRLEQLVCCARVPDPNNSRLFQQWDENDSIRMFAAPQLVLNLSVVEVVERGYLVDSDNWERMPLPDGQTNGQARDGQTGAEEQDTEIEAQYIFSGYETHFMPNSPSGVGPHP